MEFLETSVASYQSINLIIYFISAISAMCFTSDRFQHISQHHLVILVLKRLLWISFILLALKPYKAETRPRAAKESIAGQNDTLTLDGSYKAWYNVKTTCKHMKRIYGVKPGTSWGKMDKQQQKQWMSLRCDRFFCQPNVKEGKGSYRCQAISD